MGDVPSDIQSNLKSDPRVLQATLVRQRIADGHVVRLQLI